MLTNYLKKHNHFDSEENSVVLNAYLPPLTPTVVIVSIVSWVWFSISIWLSKYIYSRGILSIWEDIYGRAIVGCILSYVVVLTNKVSLCDSPANIRYKLFFLQIVFVLAFIFIMLSLQYISALEVVAILFNFYAYQQYKFMVFSVIGLTILANPLGIFVSGITRLLSVMWMVLAVVLLIIGKIITRQIKQNIYISVEMFLFNFSSLVIIPMLMIVVFSVSSMELSYGMLELWYIIVNGFITWLGIYTFVSFFNRDKRKVLEIVAYLSLVIIGISEVTINDSQNGTDISQTEISPDSIALSDPLYIGIWRIVGILVMVTFRFIFWLFKLLKALTGSDSYGYNEYFSANFID